MNKGATIIFALLFMVQCLVTVARCNIPIQSFGVRDRSIIRYDKDGCGKRQLAFQAIPSIKSTPFFQLIGIFHKVAENKVIRNGDIVNVDVCSVRSKQHSASRFSFSKTSLSYSYYNRRSGLSISSNDCKPLNFFSISNNKLSMTSSENDTIDENITNKISERDLTYMKQALQHASNGLGNTYPNPAVGCILVASSPSSPLSEDVILGSGFHPKAGFPHAEVFALFEACGHVDNGVEAALSVVASTSTSFNKNKVGASKILSSTTPDPTIVNKVQELLETYSRNGAEALFASNSFRRDLNGGDKEVTAYVTLEPCCHYGQTPPCALALVKAGVDRVVVGFRDPNPKVDGGGVTVLRNEGVRVDLMSFDSHVGGDSTHTDLSNEEQKQKVGIVAKECADIVKAFAKRISPRRTVSEGAGMDDYETNMNGAKRSALRNLAGKWKNDGSMTEFSWPVSTSNNFCNAATDKDELKSSLEDAVGALSLDHGWIEALDAALWEKELILLRLNGAVSKKKGAKLLGERIGKELGAHVAQVVGHTALLYRPGFPPCLNLDEMVEEKEN